MSKVDLGNESVISQLHAQFPALSKPIIQNELRKTQGDLTTTMKVLRRINEAVTQADEILGEEEKQYICQSDSDEDMDSSDPSNSDEDNKQIENDEEYHSQDEKEAEEVNEICKTQVNNFVGEGKTDTGNNEEQLAELISDDLSIQFPGVPKECVKECVKYFYPNMGKIEHVLAEFQRHWVEYNTNYDEYKMHKKDRRKGRRDRGEINVELDPKLSQDMELLKRQINDGKGQIPKEEWKALKHQFKGLKKIQRQQRKELKGQQKAERKALKQQAKMLKHIEKANRKAAKEEHKECTRKARGEKDYQDDVFFKEIREEPTIIKQYLKEAKKALRRAEKSGNEEEIAFYKNKISEYEKSLEEETDKVIQLTYERYNNPGQYDSRLDLHGLKKKEALRLLEKVVSLRIQQINEQHGEKDQREPFEFNIVTGSGNHSRRPVLKPAVKDYLLANNIPYAEFSNGAGYVAKL